MAPRVTLPPELDLFLRPLTYAMVTTGSSIGTVLIIKAPGPDIESCRGTRRIHVGHELFVETGGPVLRLIITIEDPSGPLRLETFANPAQTDQLNDWRSMLADDELRLVFFDQDHRPQLSKVIKMPPDETRARMIPEALKILARTDPSELDFDAAKAAVMAAHPI